MHGAPGAHREPVNWLNHRPSCCVPGVFAVETIPTFHSISRPLAPNSFGHFYPRNSPTTPTMDAATPPTNIHIALSVGEPVKKREMSELNDVDAMMPNTISRIPAARRASETALLMFFPFMNRHSPDDSRTGVNSSDFPAFLEARREVRAG